MYDPRLYFRGMGNAVRSRVLIGLFTCLSLIPHSTQGSHMFGADLYYTHEYGYTYTITMVIYADCDLANSAFNVLPTVTPQVAIYKGSTLDRTVYLSIQSPSTGVEVTPVCAGQLSNTSCVSLSGTVPGIKKYTYSLTTTIGGARSDWRFSFTGYLGNNTSAGRSNSMTNIIIPALGSLMGLDATLNNLYQPNSSPVYTTIPTPFFCINKSVSYNPGAIDSDGDSLSFALVPGIDRQTGGFATYATGLSGTMPLFAATGSFSANAQTGQINFIPNQTQRSLVVSKVFEYRNQVLVGTSMREMTFLVFNNCNNNPPGGAMVQPQGGTIHNGIEFRACAGEDTIRFQIPAADLDGDTIDMVASGVPATAQFSISNNRTRAPVGQFSWALQGVVPGTYTFFVTYTDYGCPLSSRQTIAYNIHVLPLPRMNYELVTPPSCVGKARFHVYPWSGQSPYRLEAWTSTSMVHSIQPMGSPQSDSLAPGIYTLVVRDQNGCAVDTQITIEPPPLPIPLVETILPTCDQDSNGKLILSAQGGKTPYQFALNSGGFQPSGQFGSLKAGTYTLKVRDAHLCISDTTIILDNPPALGLDILHEKPRCNFISDGVLEAFAVHGKAPYQFSLNGSPFSSQYRWTSLDAGNYLIGVRDSNQCLAEIPFSLEDSLSVHAQAMVSEVACFGDSTGSVLLGGFGTQPPYYYSLASGPLQPGTYFDGLAAGTYTLRVEDSLGCYLDSLVTIPQPPELELDIAASPLSCFGSDDGEIQALAGGGRSPYLFSLNGGSYGPASGFSPLTPGTYRIEVMDDNGCKKDSLVAIAEPPVLKITSLSGQEPQCHGGADGEAVILAVGGTPPYQFSVNSGGWQSSSTLSGLGAGIHTLRVRDARGCLADTSLLLGEPEPIRVDLEIDLPLCENLFTGEIRIQAGGGTPSYTYALGSGAYGPVPRFVHLGSGLYTLHIRDSHHCPKDTTIRLIDSLVLNFQTEITDIHCHDSSSGIIEVLNPQGGKSPYRYGLGSLPLSPLPRFEHLGAGTHRVWIRDQQGCVADTQIELRLPPRIIPQVQHNEIACHGFNNGQIQITASGGSPGYQFALDPGGFQASGQFINLYAGTYRLIVRDAQLCLRDTMITLEEPDPLEFTWMDGQSPLCHGDSSGYIEVMAKGGRAPYSFRTDYQAFEPGPRIENIPAGTHRLQVRDAFGCVLDTFLTFHSPPALVMEIPSITPPTCEQFQDGEIQVQGSGGTPPYSYVHNGSPGTSTRIAPVGAGDHRIQVVDQHGCSLDTLIHLEGFPPIRILSLNWTGPRCAYGLDGKIEVEAEGGRPPYVYKWGQGDWQSLPRFDQVGAGEWKLQIRDSEECMKDSLVRILGPEPLQLQTWSRPASCTDPQGQGQAGVEAQGGTGSYAYLWTTPSGNQNQPVIPKAEPGVYRILVSDENGCQDSALVDVEYENCCHPFVPNAFTPNGDGLNDRIHILYKGDFELIEWVIVNRYGQVVFHTEQADQGWDGKFRGMDQDLGTYYYYLKARCGKQQPHPFQMKGDFVLIR